MHNCFQGLTSHNPFSSAANYKAIKEEIHKTCVHLRGSIAVLRRSYHSKSRSATCMMICLLFCGELLLLLFFPVSSLGQDPCHNYNELNNPYRSIAYKVTVGVDTMICDVDIVSGWYRFVNEVGGEMPEFKIDSYHCGTVAPIWMQGPHPSEDDDVVDRTACVNFNNLFGGCLSFTIQVKNCGPFYVYYLVSPPFGCNMAYCAGWYCFSQF